MTIIIRKDLVLTEVRNDNDIIIILTDERNDNDIMLRITCNSSLYTK